MLSKLIEQRGGHLGIAEHLVSLAKAQVGGDDHPGALVLHFPFVLARYGRQAFG